MPRNGSDIYSIPPGTEGFPDTTIESEKYNNYIHDVEADLNTPRPISAGGTGANDADEALANLGGEKSSQRVDNYDSHVFLPGSFYSTVGASGAPPAPAGQVATHKFVGWVVSSDIPATPPANQNVVVHARDQSDITVPGRIYVREKKAGTWGPWSIDGTGVIGPMPPAEPPDGLLWWDNESGQLYVWYRDADSAQWVIASPVPDPAQFLLKAGDTMEGNLGLAAAPVADMDAANKKYVDDKVGAVDLTSRVAKAGDTMTGPLIVAADPTVDLGVATKKYVDDRAGPAAGHVPGEPSTGNAAAGEVGEFITAVATSVGIPNGVTFNVTQITLTPGDWDVEALAVLSGNPLTVQQFFNSVSTVSATTDSTVGRYYGFIGGFDPFYALTAALPRVRFSVSANTVVYLTSNITHNAGGGSMSGTISARRVR